MHNYSRHYQSERNYRVMPLHYNMLEKQSGQGEQKFESPVGPHDANCLCEERSTVVPAGAELQRMPRESRPSQDDVSRQSSNNCILRYTAQNGSNHSPKHLNFQILKNVPSLSVPCTVPPSTGFLPASMRPRHHLQRS